MTRPLPEGWRVSEPYTVSKQEDYVKQVVKELLEVPRIKIPPTTTQCASTQATLNRDPSLDEQHWNRHLPDGVQVEQIERPITPQEYEVHKSAQHAQKNTIGASTLPSVAGEKRTRGIEAFTYSEPAKLTPEQIKRLTKLEEIVNTPLEPEKPKKKWFQRLWEPKTKRLTDEEFNEYIGKN